MSADPVIVDLRAAQVTDTARVGAAREYTALAAALAAAVPTTGFLLRAGLPVPGHLTGLVSGRVVEVDRGTRTWAPGERGTFVTGGLGRSELDAAAIPPRFRRHGWRRIGILDCFDEPTGPFDSFDHLLVPRPLADAVRQRVGGLPPVTPLDPVPAFDCGPDPRGRDTALEENRLFPALPGLHTPYVLLAAPSWDAATAADAVHAFAAVDPETRRWVQLVLVGPVPDAVAASAGRAGRSYGLDVPVVTAGSLDDATLRRLLRTARCLVTSDRDDAWLGTLARGAGCPVADGPAGLVARLSDAVARDDAGDPPDPHDAATAAGPLVTLVSEGPAATPRARPRLAVVSPVPPQPTGIAACTAGLVPHLASRAEVVVYADDPGEARSVSGTPVRATRRLAEDDAAQAYDRLVTFLGNSPFHVAAEAVVAELGGAVVLHDARLTGLHAARADAADRIDPATADRLGVQQLAGVVGAADTVLVHSRYAADICEVDTGRRPTVLGMLPFAAPMAPRRAEPGRIATFGYLTPVKQPEVLLDALASLSAQGRAVTLCFAGGATADYEHYLAAAAEARGLGASVTVTGHLSDEAYRAELARCQVAVQLRSFTNGESSAAVHDALSAGLPTVVTRLGAVAEYPASAVAFVEPGASGDDLAAALAELLDDPSRMDALSEGGRALAASQPYAAYAEALLAQLGL